MKIIFAILSAFCVAIVVFASGVVTAIALLTGEPEPGPSAVTRTAELRANEPERAVAATQDLPRLPARTEPERPDVTALVQPLPDRRDTADDGAQLVDPVTTAGVSSEPTREPVPKLGAAHAEWCSQRFRSYDPVGNRYTAYSGERRECVSPYSETMAGIDDTQEAEGLISASAEDSPALSSDLDSEHVESCFDRYRSYRPEDNTYQPYGGGPRQQCQ